MVSDLLPGDQISIRALHADGRAYRWWKDAVESINEEQLVTVASAGKVVHGPRGDWTSPYSSRTFYWFDRPFNLAEIYQPNGGLLEIYCHIASPATLRDNQLTFTDHELDVVLKPGQPPQVVDEHEFVEAATRYGYTPEFQAECYRAVAEVLAFIGDWQLGGR